MIDFFRSTFTWKCHPWEPDPYYRYPGGFVGQPGQVYHVRFNLQAACEIREEASGHVAELFLGSPCRSEYTIASRNLFQIPSGEWRMAFSRQSKLDIANRPSYEEEAASTAPLDQAYQDYRIDIRNFPECEELTDSSELVQATLAQDLLNARSTYRDAEHGMTVTVEFPVNIINLNEADAEFQVCTGPILLPDLKTWNGQEVNRVFQAHVAFSAWDYVEFILQRKVAAAPEEREWLDQPRGRDRHELHDPQNPPPGTPRSRPRLSTYNETWELESSNVVLRAPNPVP